MQKSRVCLIMTLIAMILTMTLAIGFGAGTPGSEDDPIVTKGYVDQAIKEMEEWFEDLFEKQEDGLEALKDDVEAAEKNVAALQKDMTALQKDVKALKNNAGSSDTTGSSEPAEEPKEEPKDEPKDEVNDTPAPVSTGWQVVQVPAKTTVVGETGTEMILRSGSATAVDNGKNGISDLTGGKDLRMGQSITLNHLLLIPGSDGRGIKTVGMCFVMINGGYTLVQN